MLTNGWRRIEPHAENRTGRQGDVLPFGRRDRAAAADEDAEQRALDPADDAADDRADTGAGANLAGLTLDPLALERLGDGAAHRIVAAVDRQLVERHREAALALHAGRLRDAADDAADRGTGRNEDVVALEQVRDGDRFEPLL